MTIHNFEEKVLSDFWSGEVNWQIDEVMPAIDENIDCVCPEFHTHGLNKFGYNEIQIRLVLPDVAEYILNIIGGWIVSGKGKLAVGDEVTIGGIKHAVVSDKDSGDLPVLRLAWYKDPV